MMVKFIMYFIRVSFSSWCQCEGLIINKNRLVLILRNLLDVSGVRQPIFQDCFSIIRVHEK